VGEGADASIGHMESRRAAQSFKTIGIDAA
jgi:hypothetical protein